MEPQKYLLSSPSTPHDLSVCRRSWIDSPKKYSPLTMDTINQRQWKLKHFIFWPYQRTLAYTSLLKGDKILLLLQA